MELDWLSNSTFFESMLVAINGKSALICEPMWIIICDNRIKFEGISECL